VGQAPAELKLNSDGLTAQPQQRVDVGDGAQRRPRAATEALLVDDDDRGQVLDQVSVGLADPREEAADERGERLVELPLRLGGDRVEDQ